MAKKKKSSKGGKKTVKKEAPAKAERAPARTRMIAKADLTKAQLKAIEVADAAEIAVGDAEDDLMAKLENLRSVLGQPTFEHPDRGPYTVLTRGEVTFWRRNAARS